MAAKVLLSVSMYEAIGVMGLFHSKPFGYTMHTDYGSPEHEFKFLSGDEAAWDEAVDDIINRRSLPPILTEQPPR